MRDLTQEEIDNKPDWATDYGIDTAGTIRWSDNLYFQWADDNKKTPKNACGIEFKTKPIPSKPFDISVHVCNDKDSKIEVDHHHSDGVERLCIEVDAAYSCFAYMDKDDVTAMAKHFKLI